ncbi:MAG: CDP-diacylglycerol--serine O-phosphatidyltransferase [Gemmatimonadales bacterium]
MSSPPARRTAMRRVVVVVPSAFTLGNLFFGIWSIVSAYNGNYVWAGWFIVFAAILDTLDGRVARMSNTGSRFGAELDSLVDVISFGVAPALIMYFLEFSTAGRFAWVICFLYVVAAAVRLARYNVIAAQSSGKYSSWFTGLPSPAAGITLAVYYAFSQTDWYGRSLAYFDLQHQGLVALIVLISVLMVSNVKYPKFPAAGFRGTARLAGLALYIGLLVGALTVPAYFFFPLGLTYMAFGLLRSLVINLNRNDEPDDSERGDIARHRRRRENRQEQDG